MRCSLLTLILISLVSRYTESAIATPVAANAQQTSETSLFDGFPTKAGLPVGLVLIEEGGRSADDIASGFPAPAEASLLLSAWSFRGNAYRNFAMPEGMGTPSGTVYLEISLHAFATAADAADALPYYASGRANVLGIGVIPLAQVGEQSMVVGGAVESGTEATAYSRLGSILTRVTARALDGGPLSDALTVTSSVLVAASALPSSPSLIDLLPTTADVPLGLVITQDVQRSLHEVAANYSNPAETERRFVAWGWTEHAARSFDASGETGGITGVYASLHRFGSVESTSQALDYSVADQASTTGATRTSVSSFGDRVRALGLRSAGGNEVTVYAQQGTVLIRVTVVSTDNDAESTAIRLAEQVVADAERRGASAGEMGTNAAQPAQGADCKAALDSYRLLPDEELEHLAKQNSEPYGDGNTTMEDVSWMREYRDITGRTYVAGELSVLKQAHECRNRNSRDGTFQPTVAPTQPVSTGSRPDADRACEELATSESLSAGLGYTPVDVAILTGCRQTPAGNWFFPTGRRDPRLSQAWPLTRSEAEQTEAIRTLLEQQLAELTSTLAATIDPTVVYNAADPRSMSEGMEALRQDLYPGAASLGESSGLQPYYEEILVDYLRDPTHIALARYVAWWSSSRVATMPVGLCGMRMNPMACQAYIENMGFYRAPWPWELSNELTMATYLDWALTNGSVRSVSEPAS